MDKPVKHAADCERPYLLLVLSAAALLGCFSLIAGTLVAQVFVPNHNWITDTISDLGAGRWEIVMDLALYGFAAGLFATALAASHAHLGMMAWSVGTVSLAILAAIVIVVGARNEYGDGDNEGTVIHHYLVYGLGFFFALTPFCMAAGAARCSTRAALLLRILGATWLVVAPVFLLSPTDIDGLIERILGLIACAIVLSLAIIFFKRGRDQLATVRS